MTKLTPRHQALMEIMMMMMSEVWKDKLSYNQRIENNFRVENVSDKRRKWIRYKRKQEWLKSS